MHGRLASDCPSFRDEWLFLIDWECWHCWLTNFLPTTRENVCWLSVRTSEHSSLAQSLSALQKPPQSPAVKCCQLSMPACEHFTVSLMALRMVIPPLKIQMAPAQHKKVLISHKCCIGSIDLMTQQGRWSLIQPTLPEAVDFFAVAAVHWADSALLRMLQLPRK